MKKYNTDLWIKNLESIYNQAIVAQPIKPFFLMVYDYVEYILTTDQLAQLSNIFYIHKKTDYEAADQYKIELIQYIEETIPKLEQYETLNYFEKETITRIISIKSGRTQVMDDPEGWRSIFRSIVSLAFHSFKESLVNEKLLKLLAVEKYDKTNILNWQIQEVFQKYELALVQISRLKETRGWNAWEYLKFFYEMFNGYETIKYEAVKRNKLFESWNLDYLIQEIQAILKNTTYDQVKVLTYANYFIYLQKAHRQLIDEIVKFEHLYNSEKEEIGVKETMQQISFTFDVNTATVQILEKPVKFKKDTRKLTLLKLLLKKPKGIYYDEAIEALEGVITEENFNAKNSYYEACRGIETNFLKVGITDFLIFDYNQTKINPLYKLTS